MGIGHMQAKGYLAEAFAEPFRRYISRADIEALKTEMAAAQPPAEQKQPEAKDPEVGTRPPRQKIQTKTGQAHRIPF